MTNDISGHAVPPRTKRPRRTKIARKEEICGTVMAFIPVLRCILFSLIPMVLALNMMDEVRLLQHEEARFLRGREILRPG